MQGEIISMSWMDLSVEQMLRNHILTLEGEELKSSGKWYAFDLVLCMNASLVSRLSFLLPHTRAWERGHMNV